jgi:hypothetical protein
MSSKLTSILPDKGRILPGDDGFCKPKYGDLKTDVYRFLRGDYNSNKQLLSEYSRSSLEATILDDVYNQFLETWQNFEEPSPVDLPKLYHGAFWRRVPFSCPDRIQIGRMGSHVRFMMNNKWGEPARCLRLPEFEKVMYFIE